MIHKTPDETFTVQCDGCGDVIAAGLKDYDAAIFEAKLDGWRIVRSGVDFSHYCPKCDSYGDVPHGSPRSLY